MDEADHAHEMEELSRRHALAMALKQGPLIRSTGFCLYCDEPMPNDRRWCDAECRDDYEREQRRLA